MGTEIERKFIVRNNAWRAAVTGTSRLRQGYLAAANGNTVRVRTDGSRAWLTVKGPATGCRRSEFEYDVPTEDAAELLELCGDRVVEKTRSRVPVGGHVWEIDEFSGRNAGLVLAEVELTGEEESVVLPDWIGCEVTDLREFANASLSKRPFGEWTEAQRGKARME
jgi:adenylate cyclase